MFQRTTLLILFVLVFSLTALQAGEVRTLRYPPQKFGAEQKFSVTYYLWIPDGVEKVRGIIMHQHGCGEGAERGGETAIEDLHWRSLAARWDCALMAASYRANGDCENWCNPKNGSGKSFLEAIREFARRTKHPELEDAPWALWGHSGGAAWANFMLFDHPERILGVFLRSGALYFPKHEKHATEIRPAVYKVPVLANMGARELTHERFHVVGTACRKLFDTLRRGGGRIALAVDPQSSHDCAQSRFLAIPFFDACLALRFDPGESKEAQLVDHETRTFVPEAGFDGDSRNLGWVPGLRVARAWKALVTEGRVADDTPPDSAPHGLTARALSANRVELRWETIPDFESGIALFLVYRDGKPIPIAESAKSNGILPQFQRISYHDTPRLPLPEQVAVIEGVTPRAQNSFAVSFLNGSGLESPLSTKLRFRAQHEFDGRGKIRVACVGDSITAGARAKKTESYPAVLQALLGDRYVVRNFGRGGATLLKFGRPNVWQSLGSVMSWNPHIVIVALGTNDTVGGKRKNWEHIDDFDADYTELIRNLSGQRTGARILLCTPTSMVLETEGLSDSRRENLEERKPRLERLRHQVRRLAERFSGNNVVLVDLGKVLEERPDLVTSGDGVHPNAAGYHAIAATLAPRVRSSVLRPEGGYIMWQEQRTAKQIETIYRSMPVVKYKPPSGRWEHLPKTRSLIESASPLEVVMLGDSIVNDTARSSWQHLLPGAQVVTSVRGSTGCSWYQEKDRVHAYVTDHLPDLVIIGGISHGRDAEALRRVIEQIRSESKHSEVLFMTGAFGLIDPRREGWPSHLDSSGAAFRDTVRKLSEELDFAFLDMHVAWGEYIRSSGEDLDAYKRDAIHANERGEQILGRVLARYLSLTSD